MKKQNKTIATKKSNKSNKAAKVVTTAPTSTKKSLHVWTKAQLNYLTKWTTYDGTLLELTNEFNKHFKTNVTYYSLQHKVADQKLKKTIPWTSEQKELLKEWKFYDGNLEEFTNYINQKLGINKTIVAVKDVLSQMNIKKDVTKKETTKKAPNQKNDNSIKWTSSHLTFLKQWTTFNGTLFQFTELFNKNFKTNVLPGKLLAKYRTLSFVDKIKQHKVLENSETWTVEEIEFLKKWELFNGGFSAFVKIFNKHFPDTPKSQDSIRKRL